ncbi:MAG TPA: DeoR/GlpR family DNA-binding transcription regulator [Chloroflexia bacterium]|nr:DeoR/GlpR family DNA-binding transcription regulator [Chloroflexia bacterium]
MVQDSNITNLRNVAERRRQLLQLLGERSHLSVREVSEALGVSEVTVRLDFAALEREGQLQRIWGGATLPEPGRKEGTFAARLEIQKAEKQAIAEAAVEMVKDGDTLLLDASTTCFAIAQRLKEQRRDLYIITNGLYTALELANNPNITVVTLGGVVRPGTGSLVGTLGEEVLNRLHASKGFFSAMGMTVQQGLSESNLQESQLKTLMVRHVNQVIAVLDSTKLGRASFTTFCPFEKIDLLITAGQAARELSEPFIEQELEVVVV